MNLIYGLTVLLVYQLVGEVGVRALDIPVPGPVAGMALLFLTLLIRGAVGEAVERSATGLLSHLSLLFVPAGVGMMVHFERLADAWLTVLLALILSTVLTMILTAWLMRSMQRLAADREPGDE
jgi:holin-like protein